MSPRAAVRSCDGCPSFVAPSQQSTILGESVGAPICGLKMLPIISPQQSAPTQQKAMKHRAEKCADFGRDMTITPLSIGATPLFRIGMDPTAYRSDGNVTPDSACTRCANWVDPATTQRKTGFNGSICRVKGAILLPRYESLENYGTDCTDFVAFDPDTHSRNNVDRFFQFPDYRDDFLSVNVVAAYLSSMKTIVDPREWPDEKADGVVTQGMLNRGIRAWRRVSDPEGFGPDVFLPIFDSAKWQETKPEEYALIPQIGDDEEPDSYADHGSHLYTMATLWMELDETPALWGSGGVGKTEFFRWIAWLMQLPFRRISITGESDIDEIAGKMLFRNGQTEFVYGLLPEMWTKPGVGLLDEPNTGPNEVWQFIRSATDNSKMIVLAQNEKERLKRHMDLFFGIAMNPNWDILNVGTNVVGDADLSRLMHMYFGYPPADLEREIIRERVKRSGHVMREDHLTAMMRTTADLRELARTGQINSTWGVRHNIKVGKALQFFQAPKAYNIGLSNALPPEQMELVSAAVNSNFRV